MKAKAVVAALFFTRSGARRASNRTRAHRGSFALLFFALVASGALLAGGSAPATADPAAEPCPNEAIRSEQGAAGLALPDCRAYELVTPVDKDNYEPLAIPAALIEPSLVGIAGAHAAITGNRMAWLSEAVFPGSESFGLDYLSTRHAEGWGTENVIPPQTLANGTLCPNLVGIAAYSSDLSRGVLADGYGQPGSFKGEALNCGHDEPLLAPGEPEGFQNLFLRDNESRSYQLVNVTPAGAPAPQPGPGNGFQYFPASFLASSDDLSHVVFEEELPLTPEAGSEDELYEWAGGAVHLVTFLPDGTPVHGSLAGATRNTSLEEATLKFVPGNIVAFRHAVSADGSRVFFRAEGNLYLRENAAQPQSAVAGGECTEVAKACTVQLDASQGAGPGGGGNFMVASSVGSTVYFTDADSAGLTADTVPGSGENLYRYDVETGDLTNLTSAAEAGVEGVLGAGEDGSHLYFVAQGALAAGASAGQPNLYGFHGGTLTFVASLDPSSDSCDWTSPQCLSFPFQGGSTARVSANGAFLAFDSTKSLTGYDNAGPACVPITSGAEVVSGFKPGECQEIFRYDAAAETLSCASCDPAGTAPAGPAFIRMPARPTSDEEMRNFYPQRNLSDEGQVFFESPDPLVLGDVNARRDVYEYEGGHAQLISSGTVDADSVFLDASPSGNDVFFATIQPLASRDADQAYDVYDARIDGGFHEPPPPPPCEGEGCRGAGTTAPAPSSSGTASFQGPGNAKPQRKAKRHHRHRKHHHHGHHHHAKAAHRRRGESR